MTAQVDDLFEYQSAEYSVAGISEQGLFDPSLFDLRPTGISTDCWRGYQAIFALSSSHLVLHAIHVNLVIEGGGYERQKGPTIHGVTPAGPQDAHDSFNNHYVGIEYHLKYSGGLLIANGFIDDLYEHMGFHPAWKYTNVVELIFAKGILRQQFDRSERMADIRQGVLDSDGKHQSSSRPSDDEMRELVNRSFDRTY